MKKKYISVLSAAAVVSLLTPCVAKAADGDIYNYLTNSKYSSSSDYGADASKLTDVIGKLLLQGSNYGMEYNNKVYKGDDITKYITNLDKLDAITFAPVASNSNVTSKDASTFSGTEVTSVSAITTTAYKGDTTQLGFAINGGTTQADVTALTNAGYKVSYESDSLYVDASGKIDIPTTSTTTGFNYKVVISKADGTEVAESALQSVKVVDGTLAKTLTDVSVNKISKNTDGTSKPDDGQAVSNLVVGENYSVSINKYTTIKGDNKVTATDGKLTNANLKYASSNSSVVAVSSDGKIIPMGEGTANITVTADNMDTYTLPVTVKTAARVATTATADNSTLSLSSTDSTKSVKVTVLDQYGDPVVGQLIYALAVKSGSDTVMSEVSGTTDATGIASLNLSLDTATAVTGTYTVKLSTASADETKAIGQVAINYAKAGDITNYALRTTSDSLSTDGAIDYANAKDNSVNLQLVGKDANGVVGNLYTAASYDDTAKTFSFGVGNNLTAKLSGDTDAVTPTAVSGNINLAAVANKTGKVTLTVYNATLPVATYDVTTTDTTKPTITAMPKPTGAFTVTDGIGATADLGKEDGNPTTIGLQYDASTASTTELGTVGEFDFSSPVKVKEISVGGTDLTADQIAQLTLKAGQNITSSYNSKITLGNISGEKVSDLVALGNTIKVTVESQSGLDNTYTITLTAK